MPPLLTVAVPKGNGCQRQPNTDHPTPGIQYIPTDPGPPPLEQYPPAIPVRAVSQLRSLPCAYAALLTAPLAAGGALQLPRR